jgi:hypothetical protein
MVSDLSTLSAAQFDPLVGETFVFFGPEDFAPLEVRLQSVRENPHGMQQGAPRAAFSLIFVAGGPSAVRYGTLVLRHIRLGDIGPLHMEQVLNPTYGSTDAHFQVIFN